MTSETIGAKGSIKNYYKYINRAEQYFISNEISKAGQMYDSAFRWIDHPFAVDINNNLECALRMQNYSKAASLSKLLILKGVNPKYFDRVDFLEFRKTKLWADFYKSIPKLTKGRKKLIDSALAKDVQKLCDHDQELALYHRKDGSSSFEDSFYNEYSNLSVALKKLLTPANDYLSEEIIGITMENDTTISSPYFSSIIIHCFVRNQFFLEPLRLMIHEGKIKNEEAFGFWFLSLSLSGYNDVFAYKDSLYLGTLNQKSIRKPDIDLLNENPKDSEKEFYKYCFADSRENLLQKVKYAFHLKCNDGLYPYPGLFQISVSLNCIPPNENPSVFFNCFDKISILSTRGKN